MEAHVSESLRLGFGKCALQVQVPDAAPVSDVQALAGKRIVTSFEVLAGHFFADVDERAGLVGEARTQIEYVGGSVEAACALGLADAIGACNTTTHYQKLLTFARSRPCRCVEIQKSFSTQLTRA